MSIYIHDLIMTKLVLQKNRLSIIDFHSNPVFLYDGNYQKEKEKK